jgi:two-component system, NtrC family, response regulator GlrR
MATRESIHVLLVDDEPAICKALSTAISRAGFRVSTALSGADAMAIVRSERVDILITDLRIPDMRGDAMFELAAATQPHLRTRTLFTTGDISERAQQLIEGCNCPFLRKPFDLKDLLDWVRSAQPGSRSQSA